MVNIEETQDIQYEPVQLGLPGRGPFQTIVRFKEAGGDKGGVMLIDTTDGWKVVCELLPVFARQLGYLLVTSANRAEGVKSQEEEELDWGAKVLKAAGIPSVPPVDTTSLTAVLPEEGPESKIIICPSCAQPITPGSVAIYVRGVKQEGHFAHQCPECRAIL